MSSLLRQSFMTTVIVVAVATAGLTGTAHAGGAPANSDRLAAAAPSGTRPATGCLIDPAVAARCAPTQTQQAFRSLLATFVRIPDRVLRQGDAATRAWLRNDASGANQGGGDRRLALAVPGGSATFRFAGMPGDASAPAADVLRCIGTIGAVTVGLFIPAVKILKIKKLVEQVGGVWEAARLIVGGSTTIERVREVGAALSFLVAEFVGIVAIRDFCFS